jgi:hypothetical protein
VADSDAADREAQQPLLVFIHIPKTAGTAMRLVLLANERGRIRAPSNVFKGGGGLDKRPIERLRAGDPPPGLDEARILSGHVPLGIREYLPRCVAKGRELRYCTFLREPIDRSLSHFFAIRDRREGSEEQGKYALAPLPAQPTLDDMLAAGYIHDNLQTRMLCGAPEPFDDVTDEMLEQAKENLREGMVFFGLSERFDESVVLAKQRLRLRTILSRSARNSRGLTHKAAGRVNTSRPRGDDVPAELVRAAERANRYDIELYHYAAELFDSAPEREQLEFQVELAAFQAAKGEGDVELEVPPPEGFGGAKYVWRMLLHARGTLLRQEFELAEVARLKDELGDRAKAMKDELATVNKERERLAAELQDAVRGGREPERPAKRTAGSKRTRRSAKSSSPTERGAADDRAADPARAKKQTAAKAARTGGSESTEKRKRSVNAAAKPKRRAKRRRNARKRHRADRAPSPSDAAE